MSDLHDSSDDLLGQCVEHRRAGRRDAARAACERVLARDAQHAQALHYRGVLAMDDGELVHAAQWLDAAIRLQPRDAALHSHRGVVAARAGQHGEAAAYYRAALALAPDFADAHNNLGNALAALGELDAAGRHYARALELAPDFADAATNLARLHEAAGRIDEALAWYRRAHQLADDDTRPIVLAGRLLKRIERLDEAAACFEYVLEREPQHLFALSELAWIRDAQHRFDEAVALYQRALALAPQRAGLVNNLAFALTALARYDEAQEGYQRALQLDPALPEASFQLGMLLLRRGDMARGWPLFESRKRTAVGAPNYRQWPAAQWQGEPLAGKRLLLVREQGVGDQIQFIRYAAVLHAMGAEVDVWVAPELAPLCQRAPGVARALEAAPDDAQWARYDYWCDMMSVPLHLHLDGHTPPATVPYLFATHEANVRHLCAAATRSIGLVWAGNPRHVFDAFRSLPLATLAPLAACEGIAWFSLQKGAAAEQLAPLAARWPIHACGESLGDFSATAALVASLDLVITVDTSVAHLAGALGKPVWVLLAAQPDWRWGLGRAHSPWYPTARLFRQTTLGDWSNVVDELVAALGGPATPT